MTKIIDSFVKIDSVTSEFQIDGVVHTISLEDFDVYYLDEIIKSFGFEKDDEENITKEYLIEVLTDNNFDVESNIEYLLSFDYHEAQEERATLNETMFNEGQLDVFEKKTKKGKKVYLCYRNGSDWLYQIVRITYYKSNPKKKQKIKFLAMRQDDLLNTCYISDTLNTHFKQEFFKNKESE